MTATTLAAPAIAVVMSWVLLGELPTTLAMAGGVLCVVGVAISRR
jgi:drug/metabolite transporter (DMT)-like permease